MALLELAAAAVRERRWKLAVAHLDHAQRPESADEAEFVKSRASAHRIPYLGARLAGGGELAEDAMRRARHHLFKLAAETFGAGALLLAHQADDRAETLLMRLMAGSGPTGMASIRESETLGGLNIVRPLLGASRASLREHLQSLGLEWRDDPTNDNGHAKRSWVRREIIPRMDERMQTPVAPRLARAAALIERESRAQTQAVALLLEQLTAPETPPALGRLKTGHPLWRGAGSQLRAQLLRQWLWDLKPGPYPPRFDALEAALIFIEKKRRGAQLRTVESLWLVHGRGVWAFGPETSPQTRAAIAEGASCLRPWAQ